MHGANWRGSLGRRRLGRPILDTRQMHGDSGSLPVRRSPGKRQQRLRPPTGWKHCLKATRMAFCALGVGPVRSERSGWVLNHTRATQAAICRPRPD